MGKVVKIGFVEPLKQPLSACLSACLSAYWLTVYFAIACVCAFWDMRPATLPRSVSQVGAYPSQ